VRREPFVALERLDRRADGTDSSASNRQEQAQPRAHLRIGRDEKYSPPRQERNDLGPGDNSVWTSAHVAPLTLLQGYNARCPRSRIKIGQARVTMCEERGPGSGVRGQG